MNKQEIEEFIDYCVIDLEETIGTSPNSRDAIKRIMKKVALISEDSTIENSIKWIKENVNAYAYISYYSGDAVVDEENLVKDFNEAMGE